MASSLTNVPTQDQLSQQMVAQLRSLDPSVSAEVGTPERKIIDTFALMLAQAQVSGNLLAGSLDISTKYGSDLDTYVGLFGFGRQAGAYAIGFVTFGRTTASPYNITIPTGTQVQGTVTDSSGNTTTVTFQTTSAVTLTAGGTSVIAPIQALIAGVSGNVAANTITSFANISTPPLGITSVTNELPTTNGADIESDSELQVRFANTVFRNVAGTYDQYLALAVATQFSTKANVIGPISRYTEYVQVPSSDDSNANGAANQYTTALSNNPYAQYIYTDLPNYVSNGGIGSGTIFYRDGTDFTLNAPPVDAGDAYREFQAGAGVNPASNPNSPNLTLSNIYTGTDPSVQLITPGQVVLWEYAYMSAQSRNDPTRNISNCVDVFVNGSNPTTASCIIPPPTSGQSLFNSNPANKLFFSNFRRLGQPDVSPTIGNIFTGLFFQPVIGLPTSIVVSNYTYNLGEHYFCVVDVTNLGNTVRARNGIEWNATLNGLATSDTQAQTWTSGQNWNHNQVVLYDGTYYTCTATGGLTNDTTAPPSDTANWSPVSNNQPYSGQPITNTGASSLTVTGYTYDQNIVDLQTALEGSKQVATDVLAHACNTRYFKLLITVVYAPGQAASSVNPAISAAIANYFNTAYFGTIIQLTDLLSIIRQVSGVQNVRWTNDDVIAADKSLPCVQETDINGNPRTGRVYNSDFYLLDNELPSLPTGALTSDTLPGFIITPRAQNTFGL